MATLAAAAVLAGLPAGGVGACIGLPGSGKSTAAQQALDAAPWGQRAALFDPYAPRDRSNWQRGHRERAPWWPKVEAVTLDELLRRPSMLDRARRRLVVSGTRGTLDPVRLGRDFSTLVNLLWATHGYALIGEECGLYSRNAAEAINRVATGGAHAGMRLVLLCQRLGRIQKDAREGITRMVVGAQGGPEDIADLRERCGATFAAKVQSLRQPDNGRPVDFPRAWKLGDGLGPQGET